MRLTVQSVQQSQNQTHCKVDPLTSLTLPNTPAARSRWRQRWQDPSIRIPILIFIAVRLLTLIVGSTALRLGPVYNPYANATIFRESLRARQLNGPFSGLLDPWQRWDTGWYMKIGLEGYAADDGSIIFTPLYPVLMAVAGAPFGDLLAGGLLVSSVTCLGYLIVLYRLARRETGSNQAAQMTLYALIAFPTAFYLMAAYTESTFLFFTASALLASRDRRWWLAGLLAACATLTRLQGFVLFLPIGWAAFVEAPRFWRAAEVRWPERIRQAIPRLAAVGAGPLAAAAYYLYLVLAHLGSLGDAYERDWGMLVRPPWVVVIDVIGKVLSGHAAFTEVAGLVALMLIVGFCLLSLRTLPVFYHLYLWPTLILILLRYYPLYLLNGTLRYVLDFFPIFITIGLLLNRYRVLRVAWIGAGAILQMFLLFLFARWMWIS